MIIEKKAELHFEDFSPEDIFAVLFVRASDGNVFVRPIGGAWGVGINDAIEEMNSKHPGCKIKILEENCDALRKYFAPNGISVEQVM